MQAAKKQCTSNATNKKPKVQKPISPSKDPQSIAAKVIASVFSDQIIHKMFNLY